LGISQDIWLSLFRCIPHLSEEFLDFMEFSLNLTFRSCFVPYKNISIDETMRKFKGRWESKCYAPDKPVKWGLKYYSMVDASTDYLFWFKLYKQSETTLKLCSEAISTIPNDLGAYNIFADNYYGSLPLAKKIMSHGFDLTLGLRKNRKESSFLI